MSMNWNEKFWSISRTSHNPQTSCQGRTSECDNFGRSRFEMTLEVQGRAVKKVKKNVRSIQPTTQYNQSDELGTMNEYYTNTRRDQGNLAHLTCNPDIFASTGISSPVTSSTAFTILTSARVDTITENNADSAKCIAGHILQTASVRYRCVHWVKCSGRVPPR